MLNINRWAPQLFFISSTQLGVKDSDYPQINIFIVNDGGASLVDSIINQSQENHYNIIRGIASWMEQSQTLGYQQLWSYCYK